MKTVLLLLGSNIFMTVAWYGHLKYKAYPLIAVILVSWLIAFPEYCLQVPANRIGHGTFTAPQLKIIQEVISVAVFIFFCLFYLREPMRWNYVVAFVLIVAAVFFSLWEMPRVFAHGPESPEKPASSEVLEP
ncbi:MAG TPA: DMT family protein [Elusimicrobiota bacterium]|nr:DMT family protein [Elusimicrobiota bacterium]